MGAIFISVISAALFRHVVGLLAERFSYLCQPFVRENFIAMHRLASLRRMIKPAGWPPYDEVLDCDLKVAGFLLSGSPPLGIPQKATCSQKFLFK